MTLRTRLFLIFGALIAVLASAELWLVRSLAQDLDREAEGLAVSVGSGLIELISEELEDLHVVTAEAGDGPQEGAWLSAIRRIHSSRSVPQGISEHPGQVIVEIEQSARTLDREQSLILPGAAGGNQITFRVRAGTSRLGQMEEMMLYLDLDEFEQGPGSQQHAPPQMLETKVGPILRNRSIHLPETAVAVGFSSFPHKAGRGRGVPVKRDGLRTAIDHFLYRLILGSAAILGFGLLVAGFVAHRVSHPLRQLSQAARKVGEGEFGAQVEPEGDAEVRETLAAFNAMSLRLSELDAEAEQLREGQHLSELGDLARGLAHSLRNPLHVLGLAVDRLANEPNPELAATARAHIGRVDRTLRTLLALSSSGGEVLEEVDVVDLARDVTLELLQDPEGQANTKVITSGPALIRGIGAELRAVLHVLVVNAVEASPPGFLVEVVVRALPDGVEVLVLDEGSGLAAEVRERLFAPHTTTKAEGAGMGLYLARRILANRYAGSLELKDRASGGTEARMLLRQRSEPS